MASPITYQALRDWLAGFPADQMVGTSGQPCRCPVANFLRSVGASRPYVRYSHYYRSKANGRKYESPLWLKVFVDRVDLLRTNRDAEVTAGACLEILEIIGPE